MRDLGRCAVFWAGLSTLDLRWLSAEELRRADQLRHEGARERTLLGAALLRRAVSSVSGIEPADVLVERHCRWCGGPHGRPVLGGDAAAWHASVTHAGALAGVALTRAGAVGLDVEVVTGPAVPRADLLAPGEAEPQDAEDFFVRWTRKESVLKATGDGLTRPMAEVTVTAPGLPPRLLGLAGRPPAAAMADCAPRPGYVGAVTVLTGRSVRFEEFHDVAVPAPAGNR